MANKTKHLKDPSGNIEWINGKYPIPTAKGFRKDNQTPQPDNADEIEDIIDVLVAKVIHLPQFDNPSTCRYWKQLNKEKTQAEQAIQAHIDKRVNEARIDEWKLISEVTHSANLVASSYLGQARDERINQLRSEL